MIEEKLAKEKAKKTVNLKNPNKIKPVGYTTGRITDKTPEVVGKLLEVLRIDGTVSEACGYANIDRSTYYDWIKNDEVFSNKMEDAKEYMFIQARKTINKCVKEGDGKLALDVMRRRDKRYKDKSDNNLTGTISLVDLHNTVEKKEKEEK